MTIMEKFCVNVNQSLSGFLYCRRQQRFAVYVFIQEETICWLVQNILHVRTVCTLNLVIYLK